MEEKKEEKLFDVPDQMEDSLDEQAFTRAINRLSNTVRELFQNTGVIHIDRDMPAETQTIHVVSLTRKHQQKRRFVFHVILLLLCIGIAAGVIGIALKFMISANQDDIADSDTLPAIRIDEQTFPDDHFRAHIQNRYDIDQDGYLSGQERESVLVILVPTDTAITSIKGIGYFINLQSLTLSGTSVKEVDVSDNTALSFLDISNTPVETLNIEKQENLVDVRAENTPSLKEVYMPVMSKIHTFDTDGSALICEPDDSGTYIGCSFRQG